MSWCQSSANNGINLLIGNSPIAKPNTGVTLKLAEQCPALRPAMSEYEIDATTRRCALQWISAHPSDALQLYALKVLNYYNYRNELATASEQAQWRDWILFLTYYPLLLLALVRLAMFRRFPLTRNRSAYLPPLFLKRLCRCHLFHQVAL